MFDMTTKPLLDLCVFYCTERYALNSKTSIVEFKSFHRDCQCLFFSIYKKCKSNACFNFR
jgi:hypothetical protein